MKHEVEPEGIAEAVEQYIPTLYIEISKEQAETLEVGDDTEMTLKGKVKGIEMNERDQEEGRYNLSLELKEVEIMDEGEMGENAKPEITEDNKAIADLLDEDEV